MVIEVEVVVSQGYKDLMFFCAVSGSGKRSGEQSDGCDGFSGVVVMKMEIFIRDYGQWVWLQRW